MFVRDENRYDLEAIRKVNLEAFGRSSEGRLVDRLRSEGLIVASLVAVVDGRIGGNIVFSELPIRTEECVIDAAALAPLAVVPELQRRGIGTALVTEGLRACRTRRKAAVLVLGDPSYYERFGFSAAAAQNIRGPYSGPGWMALELATGALDGVEGSVTYPDAFADVES